MGFGKELLVGQVTVFQAQAVWTRSLLVMNFTRDIAHSIVAL